MATTAHYIDPVFAAKRVLVPETISRSVVEALSTRGALVTEAPPGLEELPAGTDLVVVAAESPLLAAATEAGVEVIGDVELAWRIAERPTWLAVTGTNGKTTTVGMLEAILLAAGVDAVACGIAGRPVLDAVLAGHDVLAVELTSFQLRWQSSLRPKASVLLNVAGETEDDLARVYTHTETAVFNADDVWSTLQAIGHPNAAGFTLDEPGANRFGVVDGWLMDADDRLAEVADIRAPGLHNVANALAAAALARCYGVRPTAVRDGLSAFQPGEHRAVLVGEWNNVRYVDDSKATNPHAAASSLGAYPSVVWLVGGQLKDASIDNLVAEAAPRLRGAVVIGADREVILAALARHAPQVPTYQVAPGDDEPMTAAVRAAGGMARPGDVVLLAPAAAALDMFADYASRGEAFAAAVERVLGES